MDAGIHNDRIDLISNIVIKESLRKNLADYAREKLPNESCAILLGSADTESAAVNRIVFMKNTDKSPAEFTMDPDQLFKAYEDAGGSGNDVIGIFHSHPDSEARPSETDKKFMAINPVIWAIYSVIDDELAAYGIDGQNMPYGIDVRPS